MTHGTQQIDGPGAVESHRGFRHPAFGLRSSSEDLGRRRKRFGEQPGFAGQVSRHSLLRFVLLAALRARADAHDIGDVFLRQHSNVVCQEKRAE